MREPDPNLTLLDLLLIEVEKMGLAPVICFNKLDLATAEEWEHLRSVYRDSGYPLFFLSSRTGEGIDELKHQLEGKTTVLMGNSGVGKSTLINRLCPHAMMETGVISEKLRRGRHTTRHTELFFAGAGTYLMDTPGFSAMELTGVEPEQLRFYYNEFNPYYPDCRFNDCMHTEERDCAVKRAVEEGAISRERYEQYRTLLNDIRNRKKY